MRHAHPSPVVAADIDFLRELTSTLSAPFSELCVANLYLFRNAHAYRLSQGEIPYIQGRAYDGVEHVAPLTLCDDVALADLARQTGRVLYPMPPRDGWLSEYNPDDSDYIYRAVDLVTYAGTVRKAPRNMRTRFRRNFHPRDEPFSLRLANDARSILDTWLSDVGRPWESTDFLACREAIALVEPLGLLGLMTFTGAGDPAGFILASDLGDGSAAIHFAKAKRDYPGAFPHLFSRFAEMEAYRFERLNFEQDLGKPGFRQSKRSHGPSALLHKFRLRPPGGLPGE